VKAAKWFGATYADNVTHIYTGIGHLPMEEAADRSASDVQQWLAGRTQ
jgi:pimeloyl-ACP methyl ester carboxylesterase